MLSAGMWCSVKKPLMSDCLRPIMQELESLATEDISHLCVQSCNWEEVCVCVDRVCNVVVNVHDIYFYRNENCSQRAW